MKVGEKENQYMEQRERKIQRETHRERERERIRALTNQKFLKPLNT